MPVTVAAAGSVWSRQSYYQAAAALDQGGCLPGASQAGPQGSRQATDEVCAFAQDALAGTPGCGPVDLAGPIERGLRVRVHAR